MKTTVSRIISGGQTGADRAALDAAKYLGIKTGGYCPKGYKTEAGNDKSLRHFGLRQTFTDNPAERTILNIKNSDGTVIFGNIFDRKRIISSGTLLTLNKVKEFSKPYLLNPSKKQFANWLRRYKVGILNVAGSRLSEDPCIYNTVYNFIIRSFGDDARIKFRSRVSNIIADEESGSKALLIRLISALIMYLKNSKHSKTKSCSVIAKELEPFTKGKAAEMMILNQFVKELNKEILKNPKTNILEYLNNRKNNLTAENKRLTKAAIKAINFENKTILLISNSHSIISVFKRLSKRNIKVKIIQCKSIPGGEGKIQAVAIKSYGFNVRLINDNDYRKYLLKIDFALFGCDAYNKKYFSNKTGTLEIAKYFYSFKKPVYVLADKAKYSYNFHKRKNFSGLFDVIPVSYVTKIILPE